MRARRRGILGEQHPLEGAAGGRFFALLRLWASVHKKADHDGPSGVCRECYEKAKEIRAAREEPSDE